ncbi:MAG: DUF3426 domain-containing protein [Pseudomonadota bacterium]|nr:DUF3426 domain-containing protein [Pseudomonadota bacterium]
MAEVMVTTCPACRLAFRVSDSQLAAANGLVRCGACLRVFNAHEHSRPPAPPSAAPAIVPAAPEDSDDLVIDDNFDLSLLDRLLGSPSPASPPPPTAPEVPMDGTDATPSDTNPPPRNDSQGAPAPIAASPQPPGAAAAGDGAGAASEHPATGTALHTPPADNPAAAVAADGSPPAEPSTLSILPRDLATPVFTAETFADPDGDRPRPHRLWYLALLLALLALPVQYGHFNAASLGQDPRLRPALEPLCRLTGCVIGPRADIRRIATTDLVVRSHPERPGALRVDAVLVNNAPFAQPFPHLRLRFEDLQGAVVAARTFAPREYLAGELANATSLPSRQPVRLELDIVDPGPAAVSYSLLAVDGGR